MENFNDIIKSNQLTLVDFGDNIRILKIDVDKNEAISMQYRIQSVPTFMLFMGGEAIWRQSGTIRLADFKKLVEQYL